MLDYIKFILMFGALGLLWMGIAYLIEGSSEVVGHHGYKEDQK